MAESIIKNNIKCIQTLLGSATSNTTLTLSEDITKFKFIKVAVELNGTHICHGTSITTIEDFKNLHTGTNAFGVSGYVDGRTYGYAAYVNNTTVKTQVPSSYTVKIYGIR